MEKNKNLSKDVCPECGNTLIKRRSPVVIVFAIFLFPIGLFLLLIYRWQCLRCGYVSK